MADQNFMDLASKTASGITGTDYMMLVNNSEAYKALVNDVAEAILGKLTSKSFSGLETTAKNVIGALNELNSKRTLKITGVYKTSAISDVNDLPIDCIGIVYNSALHRPTPDGTIYAIFCLGNENDNVKSQFGYTIGKDTVSYVYRNYNYQNQLWSDWKQITTKY